MSLYELRHKDTVVAVVEFPRNDSTDPVIKEVVNKDYLPLCAQSESKKISKWWKRRAVPASRSDIKQLLRKYNIGTTHQLLLDNLGLSVIDSYWLCPKGKNLSWDSVSFFKNPFNEKIAVVREEDSSNPVEDNGVLPFQSFSPIASLGGELDKKWIKKNGQLYLVKGNMPGNSFQQSLNEVFASKLHKKQGFKNHVEYRLLKFENGSIGCISPCFTSENIEFIPAWEIFEKYGYSDKASYIEQYISNCAKEGINPEEHKQFINYQFLTDFIISNKDRHLSNFGILRDSNNLSGISAAPIFDSGNSMFYDGIAVINYRSLLDIKIYSLYSTERKTIEKLNDLSFVDFDKLPNAEDVKKLYSKDLSLTSFVSRIVDCYEFKKNFAFELQQGSRFSKLSTEITSYYTSLSIAEKEDLSLYWKNRNTKKVAKRY